MTHADALIRTDPRHTHNENALLTGIVHRGHLNAIRRLLVVGVMTIRIFKSIQKMFAPLRWRQDKLNIGRTKLQLSIDVTAAPKIILILSVELIIN